MIAKYIKKRCFNSIFSSFISCLVGLFISLVIILSLSEKPFETLADFFTGVFSSPYYLGAMLNTASLFMWAGIGGAVAILSGNLNLINHGVILNYHHMIIKYQGFNYAQYNQLPRRCGTQCQTWLRKK